ncbi:MAG: hypothetical protein KJN63_04665 [Acidimicrobiia bacterium]|nr:hypothetical protein [Acidimicrobiia bacterium]
MQTDKFIRRAQRFVGDAGTVDQTVVIQKRPASAIAGGVGAFMVVAVILGFLGVTNFFIVGILGGGALGGAMAWLTQNYYLVGIGNEVQLIQLTKWSGRPEKLVKTLPRPLAVTLSKGLLVKSLTIDGERFMLSKVFEGELNSLSAA